MNHIGKIIYHREQWGYNYEGYRFELTERKDKTVLIKQHRCLFPRDERAEECLFLDTSCSFVDGDGCECCYVDEKKSRPFWYRTDEYEYSENYVRYHLHYSEEYVPGRIQRLLDEGRITSYLDDFTEKVDNAVDEQRIRLIENSKELKAMALTADNDTYYGLVNMYAMQAREIVFQNMVYR